jgi:hypothetical protein
MKKKKKKKSVKEWRHRESTKNMRPIQKGKLFFSFLPSNKNVNSKEEIWIELTVRLAETAGRVLSFIGRVLYCEALRTAHIDVLDIYTQKRVCRGSAGRFRRDYYRLTSRVSASSFIDS